MIVQKILTIVDINFSVINRDKYDALVLLFTITNE